jgi:type II secretory pathway pseudopilin PulG
VAKLWRDESGFGMLELLIAIVVLNIGLFALIGAFNASTIAVQRAATVSAAQTIADSQMEFYRSLPNCALYLDPTSFPVKNSGSAYQADTTAYSNVAFFDKSATVANQKLAPWATSSTDSTAVTAWNTSIPTSCTVSPGVINAMNAAVPGPDGTKYTVYTYMVLVQLNGGDYTKRVTVVVRNAAGRPLARETSVFDPILAR